MKTISCIQFRSNILNKPINSGNDIIFKSSSVFIDFNCNYDTLYSDIEANDVKVKGDNINFDAVEGQGVFSFSITQYNDSDLTHVVDEDYKANLGADLYFKLSMANPIPELIYSIQGLF